jgi:hypothetical protein
LSIFLPAPPFMFFDLYAYDQSLVRDPDAGADESEVWHGITRARSTGSKA